MKVAVVILNWNGKQLLEKFLPSVVDYSLEVATVYVADNASTDDSVSFVKAHYPSVKIIQNKENGGYAKGYNDALKNLTEDLYVLLNNDVEVTKNWLEPIVSAFEVDIKLVAAQPKILDYKNREYFEYAGAAGGFIDKYGYPYCRGRIFNTIEKDEGQYDDNTEIFWATGACLFVRKTSFRAVGGFDDEFFAHQEEIDLCWRLQLRGGNVKYFGNSAIYHLGGATLASINPKKTFYNFRNTLLALIKNVERSQIIQIIIVRLILDGIAAFHFLAQGKPKHFLAVFRAHFSFYALLPEFLQKRKKNATQIQYFIIKSIVYQYFIKKNINFKQLIP